MPNSDKMRAAEACSRLKKLYPDSDCTLDYGGDAWKLLVMGRLSAQCTDARVNIVCETLFDVFPTADSLADAPLEQIEEIVRPCGLYRTKAASVKAACTMLRDEFGGILPDSMEDLLRLPGVGRKIANLLLGDIYGKPAIVADTHCIRICGRLGFYPEGMKDPEKAEKIMTDIVEPSEQTGFCHRLVDFGRDICRARSPECDRCPLSDICKKHSVEVQSLTECTSTK